MRKPFLEEAINLFFLWRSLLISGNPYFSPLKILFHQVVLHDFFLENGKVSGEITNGISNEKAVSNSDSIHDDAFQIWKFRKKSSRFLQDKFRKTRNSWRFAPFFLGF